MATRPTDLHRVYIQSILARRWMKEDLALEMYKRAIGAVQAYDNNFRPTYAPDAAGFKAFVGSLSVMLESFGMETKFVKDDGSSAGDNWLVLVNTDPNETGLESSDYTKAELTYFREVLTEIVDSYPANSIGSRQASRLSSEQDVKMTKSVAETLLGTFVSRGWLKRPRRGRYSLGVRGLAELELHLKQNYNDIVKDCARCSKIVMEGLVCANGDCDAHLHTACYEGIRKGRNACPNCATSFATDKPQPIGEKAVSEVEDEYRGINKKKRSRASRANDDDDDDDDEGEGGASLEDEFNASQGQTQTQTQSGGSSRQPKNVRGRKSVVPETQIDELEYD